MSSRFNISGFVLLAAIGVALSGCIETGEHPSLPRPNMPTVGAAPAPPPSHLSEQEVTAAAIQLARNGDTSAALRAIEGAPEGELRLRLRVTVTKALAETEPASAAAFASAQPSGPTQATCIELAAHAWWLRDRETVLRWALQLTDPVIAGVARRTVAREEVRVGPRNFVDRLEKMSAGPARDDLLAITGAAWARVAPDDSIGWLSHFPAGELKTRLTSAVAFEIAQANPRRAITLAETLPTGRDRWLLFTAVAQTWVAVDSKAALGWAVGLPPGEARDAALAGVDTGFGIPGARRVAGGPDTRVGSSRTRGGASAMATDWPELRSPEFAAWLATQSPGMTRDEAILEYVRQRSAGSGGEVGPWVASLPGGPTRDRAMQVYVENLLPRSPAQAADWLRTLPPSDRSDALVEKLARQWLILNPPAAEAWLRETNLPIERQEFLLRQAGR